VLHRRVAVFETGRANVALLVAGGGSRQELDVRQCAVILFAMQSFTVEDDAVEPSGADARRVGRQLSFALYSAANRVIRLHRPFLEPLGLTYPQYLAMLALYEGVPQSVGDLGLKLGMDTGTLTPLLKRLAAAGLVTRARDPADERRVLIGLTEAGEALREAAWSIPEKIETACRLSDEDLAELRDTLDGLAVAPST
jgi:DNA-binding MarR family transcriptional regulator